MKKAILVVLMLVLAFAVTSAQLKSGGYGIQCGVTGTGGVLGGVYNLAENLRLAINVGFGSNSPAGGGASSTTIGIGGGIAYYLSTSDNLSTFVGGAASFGSAGPSGAAVTTINVSGQYGAEYWFSPRFSISGYLQVGLENKV